MKKLHICRNDCDPSHKVWNKYYPDDPIFDGECIHHKDFNHDNNKKYNLQKMTVGEHMRLHHIGKNHSLYGVGHTEETKIKMSKAQKGRIFSEETKKLMRLNHADFSGKNHPNYGKTYSEETIRKMREVKLGKKNPFYGKTHTKATLSRIRKTKLAKRKLINKQKVLA